MNSFGTLFRVSILGESHGECIGVLVDGIPAGIDISKIDFETEMLKRNPNIKGTTARKEADRPLFKSGVFNNITTGAPVLILIENSDIRSADYEKQKYLPRPSHADFVAYKKFAGFNDYRGGGPFSGRLTAGLVVVSCIAKYLLKDVSIEAKLIKAGAGLNIKENIENAMTKGDSIGGVIECIVKGVELGLGEPFFNSIESCLSHIIFSIPGIKGIEFGAGFDCVNMFGTECNDELLDMSGKTKTNNSGGINGGISNGNDIYFKVVARPTPSISVEQNTIDLKNSKNDKLVIHGRHDACFALRLPVVIEACAAIVILDFMMQNSRIPRVIDTLTR